MICLYFKKIAAGVFVFYFLVFNARAAIAEAPIDLKNSIDQKTKELLEITNQIQNTQKKIDETQTGQKTLKKEINSVDNNLNQVKLGIQSSEILIDKYKLEIESTQYNISDIEDKINNQKQAVAEGFKELQEKDRDTPLIIFLKNKSLSDSVFEIQNLNNLNNDLTNSIKELGTLKEQLGEKVNELSSKKKSKENENINLKNKKLISEEIKKEKQSLLEQTKNKEKIYQQNLSELEKRQSEIAAEIEDMDEQLRLKIDPSLLPTPRPGVLEFPVKDSRLTQEYGATSFATRGGYKGKWHNGIDFGGPIGAPIYAAEAGTVIGVGNQDKYCYRGAYGKYVVIKHDNNLTTLYSHMSLQVVNTGNTVSRGQLIGYIGKTGYATGPHLHFTVFSSATFEFKTSKMCGPMPAGGDLDPIKYL